MRRALAVWLVALAFPASAAADTTISFDDLTPGTAVTTQYANAGGPGQGVVFGPLPGGSNEPGPPTIQSAPGQAHSGTQVASIDCTYSNPPCNEGLGSTPQATGTFSVARSHVYLYAGLLGSAPPAVVTLLAFDSAGQEIAASQPVTVSQGTGVTSLISVSTPSASIVGFEVATRAGTDDNKQVAIDDFSFDTPATTGPPDFSLTPSATNVTVQHGQSSTDQISIGRINGSSGQIQFSATGLPPGVHAQFAPNPADSQTTLTLSADPTAPPTQGAAVTVTGGPLAAGAGSQAHSFTIAVNVQSVCDAVLTGQDLVDAVQSGCKLIRVLDRATINVSALDGNPASDYVGVLKLQDDVTLMSDRSNTARGGLLFFSQPVPRDPSQPKGDRKAMLELGNGDRVTGLRLGAYDTSHPRDEGDTTTNAIQISGEDIRSALVDNDEIYGWPDAGVAVGPVANDRNSIGSIRITNSYIHDTQQCSHGGYGVETGASGYALIDHNVFDYNKHAVTGDGHAGSGYVAQANFVLSGGFRCNGNYDQHFDMHGTGGGGDHVGGTAGEFIDIRDNTIRGAQTYGILCHRTRPAFDLRGTPKQKALFVSNALAWDGEDSALRVELGGGSCVPGLERYWRHKLERKRKLIVSGNRYNLDTSGELAVGDFNGDGTSDVFQATGAGWWYSPSGRGVWRFLNSNDRRLNRLALGDFNGDGKTDVFTQDGGRWSVSYGGTTPFKPLPAGSNIPMRNYRFADFDGDGKTDIFRTNGKQWFYSSGGATAWKPLATSSKKIDELRFCDFNGDGKADVFSLANHQWSVSYGGVTAWQRLNKQLSSNLSELVFGDFDGDGRCDVARVRGHSLQVSWGGTTAWQPARYEPLVGTLVGHFEGGRRDDLLQFATPAKLLYRYNLSAEFEPYRTWSSQEIR